MREKQNKSEFIARVNNELKNRAILREFYTGQFFEIVKQFDGKVYNKKFDNALKNALQSISPLFCCTCEFKSGDYYSNFRDCPYISITLFARNEKYNYEDKEELCTKVVLKRDINYNNRICYEYTKEEKTAKSWLISFDKETEEMKDTIKNYDKYMKIAQKTMQAIEAYNKMPYRVRQNIDTFGTRLY